jgi:hypothetical protein
MLLLENEFKRHEVFAQVKKKKIGRVAKMAQI